MSKLSMSLSVSVEGGARISLPSDLIDAEATSYIDVNLAPGDTDVVVEVQPSASSQLHLLVISSSLYSPDLTYVFSDGTTDAASTVTLDAPHLYSAGNLGAVGVDANQVKLSLAPAGAETTVTIFVARDATP